jgi:riboflavin kinase/FMN adenylyltransferase
VGVKPTVSDEGVPVAETHIIGYSGDLYGATVRVSLRDYVRAERRFDSIQELKEAIRNDIKTCSD